MVYCFADWVHCVAGLLSKVFIAVYHAEITYSVSQLKLQKLNYNWQYVFSHNLSSHLGLNSAVNVNWIEMRIILICSLKYTHKIHLHDHFVWLKTFKDIWIYDNY